jgi:hypothetical protein
LLPLVEVVQAPVHHILLLLELEVLDPFVIHHGVMEVDLVEGVLQVTQVVVLVEQHPLMEPVVPEEVYRVGEEQRVLEVVFLVRLVLWVMEEMEALQLMVLAAAAADTTEEVPGCQEVAVVMAAVAAALPMQTNWLHQG